MSKLLTQRHYTFSLFKMYLTGVRARKFSLTLQLLSQMTNVKQCIQGQTRRGGMFSRYDKNRTDTDQHADKNYIQILYTKFYIDPLKLIIHVSFISRFRRKYRSVVSCCFKVACLSVLVSFLKRI